MAQLSLKYTPELASAVAEALNKAEIKSFNIDLPDSNLPTISVEAHDDGVLPAVLSDQLGFYDLAAKTMAKKIADDIDKAAITALGVDWATGGNVKPSAMLSLVGEKASDYVVSPETAAKLSKEYLMKGPPGVAYPNTDEIGLPMVFSGVKIIPSAAVPPGQILASAGGKTLATNKLFAKIEKVAATLQETPVPPADTSEHVFGLGKLLKSAGFSKAMLDHEAIAKADAYMNEPVDSSAMVRLPVYLLDAFDKTLLPEDCRLVLTTSDWKLWAWEGDSGWQCQGFDQTYATQIAEAVGYASNLADANPTYHFDVSAGPDCTVVGLYHNGKLYNHVPVTHPKTSADFELVKHLQSGLIAASEIEAATITAPKTDVKYQTVEVKFNNPKVPDFPVIAHGLPLSEVVPAWATDTARFMTQCPDVLQRHGFMKIAMELWEDAHLRGLLLSVFAPFGIMLDPKLHCVEVHGVSPQFELSGQTLPQYSLQIQDYDTFPKYWFEKVEP